MSYTLTVADIASLGASIDARTRITDPAARELAKATKDAHKRDAERAKVDAAERFLDYTPEQHKRIDALRSVHWPRVTAFRNALATVDVMLKEHFIGRVPAHGGKRERVILPEAMVYDLTRRALRLEHLIRRAYAASAAIGRFPISRADMRTDRGTILVKSAWKRHFTFAGGRDWGSSEYDPADIVQGAFVRALESGDVADGIPAYGSIFRHVQAERAHLTRINDAEYSARKRAALGHVSHVREDWPEMTDKHGVRKLDTYAGNGCMFASLADHRQSLADAARDVELANVDDAVTRSARMDEIGTANAAEFHVQLADLLMRGAELSAIADALGLTVETVTERAIRSKSESFRPMATNIDHAARSSDIIRAAERETEVAEAQAKHAATLRARRVAAETVHYAMAH